ncbi:MAG: DUF4402 domain-containing protein [Bacteroidales bacterium]|nr:DUF4402 domain-containing protein [Bacteroidales bacterium]
MKLLTKTLLAASILLAFALNANAQTNTVSAEAAATIISPITISVDNNMNFGYVGATPAGGTVLLQPDGTITPTGVSLASGITTSPAIFTVTGEPSFTYSITLTNASIVLTESISSSTMTVDTFTRLPIGDGTLDVTGNQTLRIGGTLNVGASQTAGLYENTTDLEVTVNYN